MTNLFSIFDPSTSMNLSMNWLFMFSWLIIFPLSLWLMPGQIILMMKMIMNYLTKEFKPLIKKYPQMLIFSVSIFMLIICNNMPGLLPGIFTASSHMSFTLTLALPFWVALLIQMAFINTKNSLIHLIPNGTPPILMPFMVLIETISNIIRPLTLSIRLAANMIAGHLLITLIAEAAMNTPFLFSPLRDTAHNALALLEIAVAMIQAYVFSVLLTLYTSETM
uniref:ATP synthase subunit a n=1 Tax=Ampithoe lacertosa TaxID=429030 RepID=A0A5P9W7U7_9CRUS|nr:ATP synthase F0 subunit 6 [Ampithoe lacertosa]QFX74899.1 ATP synthase F0 subunit 6 [Ampithoe lacertosa]